LRCRLELRKKERLEWAYKPGFVVNGHFSGTTIARRLVEPTVRRPARSQPTREFFTGRTGPRRDDFRHHVLLPAWFCFGRGLPSQTGHPACWCALTAPFHPYLLGNIKFPRSAVCFLLHCPCPRGRWELPITLSCEARTFLCRVSVKTPTESTAAAQPTPVISHSTLISVTWRGVEVVLKGIPSQVFYASGASRNEFPTEIRWQFILESRVNCPGQLNHLH